VLPSWPASADAPRHQLTLLNSYLSQLRKSSLKTLVLFEGHRLGRVFGRTRVFVDHVEIGVAEGHFECGFVSRRLDCSVGFTVCDLGFSVLISKLVCLSDGLVALGRLHSGLELVRPI
jgi:hypothetical protein